MLGLLCSAFTSLWSSFGTTLGLLKLCMPCVGRLVVPSDSFGLNRPYFGPALLYFYLALIYFLGYAVEWSVWSFPLIRLAWIGTILGLLCSVLALRWFTFGTSLGFLKLFMPCFVWLFVAYGLFGLRRHYFGLALFHFYPALIYFRHEFGFAQAIYALRWSVCRLFWFIWLGSPQFFGLLCSTWTSLWSTFGTSWGLPKLIMPCKNGVT